MEDQVPVEKLVRAYVKMRDKKAVMAAEFKAKEDEIDRQLNMVKAALLEHCKTHNVESVRTTEGLFYRSVKTRYWTSDWEAMYRFILNEGNPELLEKRVNQTAMKQFLEENPDKLPPGMNVDSEYVIAVRKA